VALFAGTVVATSGAASNVRTAFARHRVRRIRGVLMVTCAANTVSVHVSALAKSAFG
jgi:hypothetical protein